MVTFALWAFGTGATLLLLLLIWAAIALRPSLEDHEMIEPGDLE